MDDFWNANIWLNNEIKYCLKLTLGISACCQLVSFIWLVQYYKLPIHNWCNIRAIQLAIQMEIKCKTNT